MTGIQTCLSDYNSFYTESPGLNWLKYRFGRCLMVFLVGMMVLSCDENPTQSDSNNGDEPPEGDVVPYMAGIRIAWDYRTLTEVYSKPSSYARFHELTDGTLVCTFESLGASMVSFSNDEGETWSEPVTVAQPDNGVIAAVPELLQLDSGDILLAYNTRPPMDNQNPSRRFGIKLKISRDGGNTWEHWSDVYEADYRSANGVWEPHMIQRENGEVQLYAANEYPYQNSNDQEITMFRSNDRGKTWTDTVTISYRPGHRDGMPVPLIMNNADGIAVAIEDNGISGKFKPAIIWSSIEDNWSQRQAGPDSPRRWRALAAGSRLSANDYGGGPYLVQLERGPTILSFQSNMDRPGRWNQSTMMVAIGNEEAKSFNRLSRPFDIPDDRRALWNSLFVKDQQTVTAVTTTNAFNPNHQQVYAIDGYVINELQAVKGNIQFDGELSEEVWTQSVSSFVGARSPTRATITTAWDEEAFYAAFEVADTDLWSDSNRPQEDDGVQLYWATDRLTSDALVEGTRSVIIPVNGDPEFFEGSSSGNLVEVEAPADVASKVSLKGTLNNASDQDSGYTVEVKIPWDSFGGRPEVGESWGIHFTLTGDEGGGNADIREGVAGNSRGDPSSWHKIELIQN